MRIKEHPLMLLILCIPMAAFSVNNADTCTSTKNVTQCDFSSLKKPPENSVFIYCTTKQSKTIEMYSNDVLVRGFNGSIQTGTGKLILHGKNEIKKLNTHYFRVLLNPLSTNNPNVRIYADHDVTCKIGKGLWRSEMPGNLD